MTTIKTLNLFYCDDIANLINKYLIIIVIQDKNHGIDSQRGGLMYHKKLVCYLWDINSTLLDYYEGEGAMHFYVNKRVRSIRPLIPINKNISYINNFFDIYGYTLVKEDENKVAILKALYGCVEGHNKINKWCMPCIKKFAGHPDVVSYFDVSNSPDLKKIIISNDHHTTLINNHLVIKLNHYII